MPKIVRLAGKIIGLAGCVVITLFVGYFAFVSTKSMPEFYNREYTYLFEPLTHLLGFVALTLGYALVVSRRHLVVLMLLLAVLVEAVQAFIPGRTATLEDFVWSVIGVVTGWILVRGAVAFLAFMGIGAR